MCKLSWTAVKNIKYIPNLIFGCVFEMNAKNGVERSSPRSTPFLALKSRKGKLSGEKHRQVPFSGGIIQEKAQERLTLGFSCFRGRLLAGSEDDILFSCQAVLDAPDDFIQVPLLVDVIQIIGMDGQNRANIENLHPVIVKRF